MISEILLCVAGLVLLFLPIAIIMILDWRRYRREDEAFALICVRLAERITEVQARIATRGQRPS